MSSQAPAGSRANVLQSSALSEGTQISPGSWAELMGLVQQKSSMGMPGSSSGAEDIQVVNRRILELWPRLQARQVDEVTQAAQRGRAIQDLGLVGAHLLQAQRATPPLQVTEEPITPPQDPLRENKTPADFAAHQQAVLQSQISTVTKRLESEAVPPCSQGEVAPSTSSLVSGGARSRRRNRGGRPNKGPSGGGETLSTGTSEVYRRCPSLGWLYLATGLCFFFPTLLCGVLVFFAAPPRSSSSVLLPPSSFLLSNYNLSQQHHSDNIPHTTSCIQHHSHNISHNNISHTQHTTSLTQHRMPRGRMTKHHSENIPHTTSHTPQHTHNISHNNISHTTAHTQHHSQAQHISWQAQHFAACQGVGCTPWRRLGTGAGCADFVAGAALCEPSCADFVAGAVLCEPPCADLVAGTALCCLPRGRMYALASAGHRRWMCRFRGRRSAL